LCNGQLIPERLRLSAQGYHRVLRVARTLAELDLSANLRRTHLTEAPGYRRIQPGDVMR
jgi:magnesium chelatase family protein